MRARPMELRPDAWKIHQRSRADKCISESIHAGKGWEDVLVILRNDGIKFAGIENYVRRAMLGPRNE